MVSGSVFVADTPCDENSAPSTCPGPGYLTAASTSLTVAVMD
ncbi:MAG: hypothetical protein ACLP7W_11660 [Solirubrobacteraceae bacterium]|jgi:hypothetical protein